MARVALVTGGMGGLGEAVCIKLAALGYRIFAPFLTLMVWALILAVALYPLHQMLARRLGDKQGLAATLISLTAAVLIVAPTAVLMGSLADSVQEYVQAIQDDLRWLGFWRLVVRADGASTDR